MVLEEKYEYRLEIGSDEVSVVGGLIAWMAGWVRCVKLDGSAVEGGRFRGGRLLLWLTGWSAGTGISL